MKRRSRIFGAESISTPQQELEIIEVSASDKRLIEFQLLEAHCGLMDAEAVQVCENLHKYQAASEALEQIADLIEKSIQTRGGLDQTSAGFVQLGLEQLESSLEVSFSNKTIALESFENSPRYSSQIALEVVYDRMQVLWMTLVESLKKAVAWLIKSFTRLTDARERLQEQATKLQEKLKDTSDWRDKQRIVNDVLSSRLTTEGRQSDSLMDCFKETVQLLMKLSVGSSEELLKTVRFLNGRMSSPVLSSTDRQAVETTMLSVFQHGIRDKILADFKKMVSADDEAVYQSKPLLGGMVLRMTVPQNIEQLADFSIRKEYLNFHAWKDLPRLSKTDIQLIISVVFKFQEYEKRVHPYRNALEDLRKSTEKISGVYSRQVGQSKDDAALLRRSITGLLNASMSIPSVCNSSLISACTNMLELASLSIPK